MSFKEYSKEEFEEKKKQVFEKQEQMFLESVYHLFQNFDLVIEKGNHSEISNYIIILSSLFTLIENNHWINLYETLDEKLQNNITYRTFKNKRGAMTELIGKKSDFQLNKTWKGGSGFLTMAIVGIAVASSLIQSISAMGGFPVDALYKNNIVKNFLSTHSDKDACKQFIHSVSNFGGSCAVNANLASTISSKHADILNTMEERHAPSAQAELIVQMSKNQPRYTRKNFIGSEHATRFPYSKSTDSGFDNWDDLKNSMAGRGEIIHDNWQTSTNSVVDDIGITTIGISTTHGGSHACNMITRKVGGTIKIGLIDSNSYSEILAVKKNADGNSVCVPGAAYTKGFIYAENDFFTSSELYKIGIVHTRRPIEDFFKSLPSGRKVNAKNITLNYYDSENVPTSSQFPIMEFGITDIERLIELKNNANKMSDNFFDILKKHPNAIKPSTIIWDETLGQYTFHPSVMPGGKTKRFKRRNKKSKRNKK